MFRRKFTKEFKEAAVRKLIRGAPAQKVAYSCRVAPAVLRRWQKEFEKFGARAFGGYGKNRHSRAEPRSRAILFYLTPGELDAVKMASSAAGFRSLAEFARSRIFHPTNETSPVQVQNVLKELAVVVRKLTRRLAKE
jgi:transposase-like protein